MELPASPTNGAAGSGIVRHILYYMDLLVIGMAERTEVTGQSVSTFPASIPPYARL